jgi:hypothetical protein
MAQEMWWMLLGAGIPGLVFLLYLLWIKFGFGKWIISKTGNKKTIFEKKN